METKAKVIEIGPQAQTSTDPLIILFGMSASETLKEVAVIQQFESKTELADLKLIERDQIKIDDAVFNVDYVGKLVEVNLHSIQHANLIFHAAPAKDKLENGIYLVDGQQPKLKIGTIITYIHQL